MEGSTSKGIDKCLDNLNDERSFAFLVDNKCVTDHDEKRVKSITKITEPKIPYLAVSNRNSLDNYDYQQNYENNQVPDKETLFIHHGSAKKDQHNRLEEYNVNEDFESVNSFFEHEFKYDSQNQLQSNSSAFPLHISSDKVNKLTEKKEAVNLEEKHHVLNNSKNSGCENKRENQKENFNVKGKKKKKTKCLSKTQPFSNDSLVSSKLMKESQQYSFPCNLCFCNFTHPYDCLVHMITKICIKVSSHLYRSGTGLTCKTCGKTNFESSKQAEQHASIHEKDKDKHCPVCPEKFSPASVRQMVVHVQENHKEYLYTLNIRKWVRKQTVRNDKEKCEIASKILKGNAQLASIAKSKPVQKLLQHSLCETQKSCDRKKINNIQNKLEDINVKSNKALVKEKHQHDLAISNVSSLPEVTNVKISHNFSEPLSKASISSSEGLTKSEIKTSNTLSNLKDSTLSEEHIFEDKFINSISLENIPICETIISDEQEVDKKLPKEIKNSNEESDDTFLGICFCENKCQIHKELSNNILEGCDVTEEFLEDLLTCPDCIHTCGGDEEDSFLTSNTPESSSFNLSDAKNKQCPYCDKKYVSNYKLKIHLYSHSGVRPFVCDICGHGFSRRPNLMAHYRVHTGAKEYPCTKCDRTFGHPSDRIAHLINRVCDRAVHVKETEDGWQCITCGKSEFTSYNQAERHGRTHESAHIKKCPVCQEEFRGRKLHPLVKHVRTCHPDYLRDLGL